MPRLGELREHSRHNIASSTITTMSEPAGTELLPPLRHGWRGDLAVRDAKKSGRATVLDVSGDEILVLEPIEIQHLPHEDRINYVARLRDMSYEPMVGRDLYRRWLDHRERCHGRDPDTGDQCRTRAIDGSVYCLPHAAVDSSANEKIQKLRAQKARLRMAELLEAAVDVMEDALTSEDVPVSIRYKAATEVLDRAGVPKRSESSLHVDAEIVHVDASAVIGERLDQLREALTGSTSNREMIEGTVVDDSDPD